MIFVSLFLYIFPSLTQGGKKDSEAYQKLEGFNKEKKVETIDTWYVEGSK